MEPTFERRILLGKEAEALLNGDGALEIALDLSRGAFIERWIESDDLAEHARCHSGIHALSEVERNLRIIQEDGEVAEDDLAGTDPGE